MQIDITDVFLRDGLQDEDVTVPTGRKLDIYQGLVAAGVRRIEAASFVNPNKVPQMADAEELFAGLGHHEGVVSTALALNGRGIQRAVDAGVRNIQIVASASQAHSNANAGSSTKDALADLGRRVAEFPDIEFYAGISTAFTCPFEGHIAPAQLLSVVRGFLDMGVTNIGLADTLGTTPTNRLIESVHYVMEAEPGVKWFLHLHNAHGQALDTVDAAIGLGITNFDSALAGYGGCPFAPGAHGNLATEELVRHLHTQGHQTGIDQSSIEDAAEMARQILSQTMSTTEGSVSDFPAPGVEIREEGQSWSISSR
ncbi:hydroxymethylglutaryl-CoA lyase [Arthrobacter sp. H14]|uniref:hydroxymethylglutaryl-CoA lyase n=1 Tax=Arthrobacter sp. H14 TaxID=1312959 RepID=UPI0004B73CC9|nr:hydroxymethylglutaryl-CoA lyase [Arthrobacter sp. H14]